MTIPSKVESSDREGLDQKNLAPTRTNFTYSQMNYGPYVIHEFGSDIDHHYQTNLGWFTAACATSLSWPSEDVMINYDGEDFFLRGIRLRGGHLSGPAISIRLNGRDENCVMALVLRFASVLGWFKNGFIEMGSYITSSHPIVISEASPHTGFVNESPSSFNCNYLPLIKDEATRRALAFWREGQRLKHIHSGYSFLSFFKVIESQLDSKKRPEWIRNALPSLKEEAQLRISEIKKITPDVGKHIYESGRSAIAHANFADGRGDPDVPEDRRRLSRELVIIESLAEKYIVEVLRVPDQSQVEICRDRLEAFEDLVDISTLRALREKSFISRRRIFTKTFSVGLARWPKRPIALLSHLRLCVVEAREGVAKTVIRTTSGNLKIILLFDFPRGRAHFCPDEFAIREKDDLQSIEECIVGHELLRQIISNGRFELWLPGSRRIDIEVFFPFNINLSLTLKKLEEIINQLKDKYNDTKQPN